MISLLAGADVLQLGDETGQLSAAGQREEAEWGEEGRRMMLGRLC